MSDQCSPCGREFTTLAAFDRHQDVVYGRTPPVICLDPAAVGLVQNAAGRWHFPATEASRARHEKLRAERAQAHTSGTPRHV